MNPDECRYKATGRDFLQSLEVLPGKGDRAPRIRRHRGTRPPGGVLDIGGGLGPYRESLSYTSYYSLEINPALSPDIVGSALDLPVRSGTTDSVLCNEVLEHLPDPAGAVREIHRVLQPGGRVYVTVPFLWCLHYEPHDYFRFTGHALRTIFEGAGFRVLRIEPMGRVFSYLAARLAEKWAISRGSSSSSCHAGCGRSRHCRSSSRSTGSCTRWPPCST